MIGVHEVLAVVLMAKKYASTSAGSMPLTANKTDLTFQ